MRCAAILSYDIKMLKIYQASTTVEFTPVKRGFDTSGRFGVKTWLGINRPLKMSPVRRISNATADKSPGLAQLRSVGK
jgi:hypothetical protein